MSALRIWTCCHACRGVLMQAAIALDTRNPLARFELANVLMAQERLEEALQQLQELAVSARLKRCNTGIHACLILYFAVAGSDAHGHYSLIAGGGQYTARFMRAVVGSVLVTCSRYLEST